MSTSARAFSVCSRTFALFFCLVCGFAQEGGGDAPNLISPLESQSNHLGGLRSYGPLQINDVTGKALVVLPRIGPSELLSITPKVRTRLEEDQLYPVASNLDLIDQFDLLGRGGSFGWGHFWVTRPTEFTGREQGSPMTYYQHGKGEPVRFKRDYLFQDHFSGPTPEPSYFTFQNTIDQSLRRMIWQPTSGNPYDGDYLLLEPSGRKIHFKSRVWVVADLSTATERLYYPTRVEDPDGESVDISYLHDAQGNQTALISELKDNHGRRLRLSYLVDGGPSYLSEVRLFAPGEDPATVPGIRLARFEYQLNGYAGGHHKSVSRVIDAEGHEWHLTWSQNAVFRLDQITVPSGATISLDWELVSIPNGHLPYELPAPVTTNRVVAVTMADDDAMRAYHYTWKTRSEGAYANNLLDVTLLGPDGLRQVTSYRNMPTWLEPVGNHYHKIHFPTAGFPVARETEYGGTVMREEWDWEPLFLWSTSFQPPHYSIFGADYGDALAWSVRPVRYSVFKDGRWYDTVHTYGFNHRASGEIEGLPNQAMLAPLTTELSIRGGSQRFRRSFTYENRVQIRRECHENHATTPYALNLPTSVTEYYTPENGPGQVVSKQTKVYGLADRPLPTLVQDWASPSQALDSHSEFLPNQGKPSRVWVGDDPALALRFLAYQYGRPSREAAPLQPETVRVFDVQGNARSVTERGILTQFDYDGLGRVTRRHRSGEQDGHLSYSAPQDPERYVISGLGDDLRHQQRTDLDGWGRAIAVSTAVAPELWSIVDTFYDGLGQVGRVVSAKEATREIRYDVLGRPLEHAIRDGAGVLVETRAYQYEGLANGDLLTTETRTRQQQMTVIQTKTDLIGRIVASSTNKDRAGSGGTLTSDDYAGGGHTLFTYVQDPNTWRVTTTMQPYGLVTTLPRREVRDLLDRLVEIHDPEYGGGAITYDYDDRGLLAVAYFPDGRSWHHSYDEAGRLVEVVQRDARNPDQSLTLTELDYDPVYGFADRQAAKLSTLATRVLAERSQPDALGRPTHAGLRLDEPTYWRAELARDLRRLANQEQVWDLQWRPLTPHSGLEIEYVVELAPITGARASLYFAEIRRSRPEDPLITWTLDAAKLTDAIALQLAHHPDRQAWLDEVELGLQEYTLLDPQRAYRFRVTAIDRGPQASLASYWWGDLANLVVDDFDVQVSGQTLDLDFRVFNAGTRPTAASTTKVYFSATPNLPADAVPVATFATAVIQPGFAAYHSLGDVNYRGFAYVFVLLDTDRGNLELDENDNTARAFIVYQGQSSAAKPDVVVEAMDYAYVGLGSAYQTYATYAILNQNPLLSTAQDGMGSPGDAVNRLYYSSDNLVSNDDLLLASPECGPLGPLEREIQTTALGVFNQPVPLHQTQLLASLNSGQDEEPRFDEGPNRFNNVATVALPQLEGLGPNLVVAHFNHQGVTGTAGQYRMNLEFTLRNLGVWPAARSHVGFFLSSDATFSTNDTRLYLTDGSLSLAVEGLLPGWDHAHEGSASLVLPSATGYLIVVADVDQEVVESDEQNWRSQSFQGYADLALEQVTYDAVAKRYRMVVRNRGELASPASDVKAYVDFVDRYQPQASYLVSSLFAVPALAPGAVTASFTTPVGWAPPQSNLNTFLFFVVDAADSLHERDETNNISAAYAVLGTGQGSAKPDLIPDRWGFTHDIWPVPEPLVSPDLEIGRCRVQAPYFYCEMRGRSNSAPLDWQIEVRMSADTTFGNGDDAVYTMDGWPFTGEEQQVFSGHYPSFDPPKNHVRFRVTGSLAESRATNNTVITRANLPDVMAVHAVTNQASVACGPSTVAVFMSRDNLTTVSPADVLVELYLDSGFRFAGSNPAPMLAYDAAFMDRFHSLPGWYLKFVVDALNAVDEADETNNVLVVEADPARYHGPEMPRGLPPLPPPGPGSFSNLAYVEGSAREFAVRVDSYRYDASKGLYDVTFRLQNLTAKALAIANLSVFASSDLSLNTHAVLLCSSLLAGDSTGNKSFPSSVSAYGTSASTRYRVRVPAAFLGTPFKLLFVANAKKVNAGDDKRPYLFYDNKDTRILGALEPEQMTE